MAAKGVAVILNREQETAVANSKPVALNVAGTECVLLRRDIYLHMDPDYQNRAVDGPGDELISGRGGRDDFATGIA